MKVTWQAMSVSPGSSLDFLWNNSIPATKSWWWWQGPQKDEDEGGQDYGDYHDDVNNYDHNHHDNDLYNSFILESDNLDGCLKSVKLSSHIVVEIL